MAHGGGAPGGGKKGKRKSDARGRNAKSKESTLQPGLLTPLQYAHVQLRSGHFLALDVQETVLWAPLLRATAGVAKAAFDLPGQVTTFRILVCGHDPEGRLGVFHGRLQSGLTQPPPVKPVRQK
jgi:hypothetical protein